MHTANQINHFKPPFTPINDEADILRYYRNNTSSTDLPESVRHPLKTKAKERYLEEIKERRYVDLYSLFLTKWQEYKLNFSAFEEAFVFDKIKLVFDKFLSLNPVYITFDLTNDCSVFFQANIEKNNIYLELYFAKDVNGGVEAITNIYKTSVCIFAFGGAIETTFLHISKIIEEQNFTESFTPTSYEIPHKAFTQAILQEN